MGKGSDVIIALVAGILFYAFVYKTAWFQNLIKRGTGGGGTTTTTTTTTGGGSVTGKMIYPTTGKAATCADGSQSIGCGGKNVHSERTDCTNANFTNQEATGTIQFAGSCGCGDEATIKHWGPGHHSRADCCWEIGTVNQKGQVGFNMEGPHPDTTNPKPETAVGNVGDLTNKQVSIKSIIWKTATGGHHEIWIDTTNTLQNWKKVAAREITSWGATSKTSTVSANQQPEFRCDCDAAKWTNVSVVEIQPPGATAAAAYSGYNAYDAYKSIVNSRPYIPRIRISNTRR